MWQLILSGLSIESKRGILEYVILRGGLAQLLGQVLLFCLTVLVGVLYKENAEILRIFRLFFK